MSATFEDPEEEPEEEKSADAGEVDDHRVGEFEDEESPEDADDRLLDEQGKESFPASDPPAQ